MACDHSFAERESVCADGACPICAAAHIERLRTALEAIAGYRPYPEPDDGQEIWDHTDVARAALDQQTGAGR